MRLHSLFRPRIRKGISLLVAASILFGITADVVQGQSRTELERQKKQKENEIAMTKKLLNETSQQKKETLQYLNTLNKQIRSREELIGTMQNEVHVLTLGIEQESDIITALDSDMAALKKEYAKLLYFMYKNRSSYNMLSFVFASKSFNEAFKRIKFIQFYSTYRKKQMELISRTGESLAKKVTDLRTRQMEKEVILGQVNDQKQELEKDKKEQSDLAIKLKGKEQDLRRQLKEQQRVAARLDKAIRDIIAKEIANANKKAPVSEKRKPNVPVLDNTPEMVKLSSEFAGNRSRLPWPVEKGFISDHFGTHEHPTLEHVVINNSGVKIRTPDGAHARSIFAGEVVSVVKIPGANKAVIIKHGSYFTVYSNLDDVAVHPGQKVSLKQDIGTVAVNRISGETEIELQIWYGGQKLDPENWLYQR